MDNESPESALVPTTANGSSINNTLIPHLQRHAISDDVTIRHGHEFHLMLLFCPKQS
jgi:hypothetical protein